MTIPPHYRLCLLVLSVMMLIPSSVAAQPPTIRNITIERREIFENGELNSFYRTVNDLKISTKEQVIRRELLFNTGDVYDEFLIAESARNLRALPFFRDVRITSEEHGDVVDIVVSVQETWTLIPQISGFGGGGVSKKSIGVTEGNLLGYGKRLELLYADDEGREKYEAVWEDTRLLDTYQRLLLGVFQRSDGYRTVGVYGRPFRSLIDRDSWTAYADVSDTVGRLFEESEESYIYRQKHEEAGFRYTLASGDPEVRLRRLTAGYEFESDRFQEATAQDYVDVDVDPASVSQDPALLADDRRFSGPYMLFDQISPDYIAVSHIDRFERVQDFNLGNELSLRSQVAPKVFGSLADTLLVNVSARSGRRFSRTSFLRGEIGASTRFDTDGPANTFLRLELKAFHPLGAVFWRDIYWGNHTLAGQLALDYGNDLDRDRQLLLGAENGLRGYESRLFTGDKRFLVSVEDRIHIIEDVWRLVNIGTVVFADAGGATYDAFGRLFANNFYTNVGVGLRIGFPRSQGGSVLRIDLGIPLRNSPDGEHDAGEPLLFISTGQAFGGSLRAESLGIEKANVSVGLDR